MMGKAWVVRHIPKMLCCVVLGPLFWKCLPPSGFSLQINSNTMDGYDFTTNMTHNFNMMLSHLLHIQKTGFLFVKKAGHEI